MSVLWYSIEQTFLEHMFALEGAVTRTDVENRIYLCIDLKTFYASVECADRGLDPLEDDLVVADESRGSGTICLAVSGSLKAKGVRNRCRLFEIPRNIHPIIAPPRMRHYMEVSAQIYGTYLEYISPDDIHVYSVDECFIDATPYLSLYGCSARELAVELMDAVYKRFKIRATTGIGTNLFLAKVALDITAKHVSDGIGYLDERNFKSAIWHHRPITDIWGIGPGIAARLERLGAYDLAGVCKLDESSLYREFGVTAEYLIDHAYGREPCTMAQIHAYKPRATSMSAGQVLACPYSYEDAHTVMREMVEGIALDLVDKAVVCSHVSLYVGYAKPNDAKPLNRQRHAGEHGTRCIVGGYGFGGASASRKLGVYTNSFKELMRRFDAIYAEVCDPERQIKRVNIGVGNLLPEELRTFDLFSDVESQKQEHSLQKAVLDVKNRYGKNALLRGTSYREHATGRERNEQIGGHRA